MTPTATVLAARGTHGIRGRGSRLARVVHDELMALAPEVRRGLMRGLPPRERVEVLKIAEIEGGTPFALWYDDPVGFTEDALGEATWSRQRAVLSALPHYVQIFVPSAHGTGKTHIAARAAIWAVLTNPPGSALTVTTAPRKRQVVELLWPHIRRLVQRAELPGHCDTAQWKMPDRHGFEHKVAYGFSSPDHDESAVSGIHIAGRLFVIVDEAGGIAKAIGTAMYGLLTGDGTTMLAIGNPSTDDESTWFEEVCTSGEGGVKVVRIPATASPNVTGEHLAQCTLCPPAKGPHTPALHLVGEKWISQAVRVHGEGSAYVTARVHAQFPHGVTDQAIPTVWVDLAAESADPEGPGYVRLDALGLASETDPWPVARGSWVRLGVDVAAAGGDELAISRIVGDLLTVRHHSAGAENAHSMHVAGKILTEIRAAEALAAAIGSTAQVTVKVDGTGLGWGVVGDLQAWGLEGRHRAEIVPVIVAESPAFPDEYATLNPATKRDEMWLCTRDHLQPGTYGAPGRLRLRVDAMTRMQLSAPRMTTNASGFTVIESKKAMRARGVTSPDRAESALLAVYEPPAPELARLLF